MTSFLRFAFWLGIAAIAAPAAADINQLIHTKGSDTMVMVAHAWAEAFETVHPEITVSVGGGGSGTGFAALLDGKVEIANASRAISTHELESARRVGMDPVEHIVGYDALAVFVHPHNPVESLSLEHLAGIFGDGASIRTWSDLGVEVPGCADQEIVRAGRQNNSGTYVYFRDAVLGKGRDYDLGIMDMLSSRDVAHLVEKTPCAIGYSGLAYATPKVRMVCLKDSSTQACIDPSVESAADGSYPISRPLFMYTRVSPGGALGTYMDWILSEAGQCIILQQGYAPVKPVQCK